ncbi:MAG: hypothetical protein EPO08_16465 [Rhodospirillaceae bacterium]|nr:MAG: hypothetical protein EPO08_16465 [Rhodospirillaceae bacterium]
MKDTKSKAARIGIMTNSKGDEFFEQKEFKVCCATEIITSFKPQMRGDTDGWIFHISIQCGLVLTSATARSKRTLKYPCWLAMQPEHRNVVQVQEFNASGEGRHLFFAEWNTAKLPVFRIFERGSWKKMVLARADELMASKY